MQNIYKKILSIKQGRQNITTNGNIYWNFLQRLEKKHLSFEESLSDLCGT